MSEHRMSPVRWWRWLLVAASLTVLGAGLAATPDRLEARITSRRPPAGPAPRAAPFRPTERPSLDGSPVTCVIVTSEALAGEFERLAAWRLRTGTRAVVRTVAWIDARYAGADGAARVRAFLTDAYVLWGTRQVVLAGDVDQVPVRYLVSRYFVEDPAVDHWEIPSDLYYAGLDGDWNADGDALAGEVGDGADFEPELQVGRIPVATPAEARGFVERQLAYERGDAFDDTYPATAVFLAEVLFESGGTVELDGAEYAEHMIEGLPPTLPVRRLYESTSTWPHDAPLGRETALAELDAGPGLVVHVGHGFRATLSVGAGAIGNLDIDGLGNGRRRPIMLALNCSSAAFDYHSIAERLLLGEGGGVIAYVGMSRFAFPPTADLYQRVLVWAAYARGAPTLGAALDSTWALLGSVGAATDSTAHRYTKFALAVLGDPATPIHARPPGRLMVEHPAHVAADASSIRATVRDSGGMPVAGARVTLDAPAELHVSGLTAADGTVELPCAVPAAGVVSVTATAPGYRPALSSLCAGTAAGAVLDLARLEVAGGTLAAGQCAELALEIENTGAATAGDARVELSLLSGAGRLVAASHALGDVAPGARVTVQGDSLCVEPGARDGETLVVEAHLVHDGGERRLRRALTAGAVRLVHVGQEIDDTDGDGLIEAGERAVVRLEVRNLGGATAAALEAVLEVVERATGLPAASATVERARARFGDLAPGEIARGEPCILRLAPDADPATLLLRVTFDRPLEQQPASPVVAIDLEPPPAPTGIAGALPAAGVRLTWEPVAADDLWGYAIERAPALAGPFTEIAVQAAGAGTRYADPAVVPWRSYAYRVRAVDDSRHRGPPSAAALLASNPPPAAGWPRPLGVETTSSPVLVDLDGDGACEIVIGADGVYVFRGDGSGWLDASGGGARFTSDGVVPAARSYESTAAVADLDGDGALEIAAVAWQRAELHVWRLDGSAVDGWPRSLIGPPNWGSPVAADLDADGDLELVVLSGAQGRLFAWHHDGREVRDGDGDPTTDGVFAHSGAAFSFATPAAGDVDGEPGAEIVVGYDAPAGALHVYRADGSEPPGWPLALGGPISASPALADLDDDGRLEILVAVEETDSVYVLDGDGRPRSGWPRPATVRNAAARTSSPVVADLDGDGRQDVVFADNAGLLHAWDRDGEVLSGWEAVTFATDIEAQGAHATQSTPVIGDLDGEPGLEVVLGAEDGRVYAWHAGGSPVRGFPIQTAGEVRGSPALGDVDGDGQVELVVGASDQQLGVWDVAGDPLRQPWPLFRRTPANDGNASASGLLAPEEPQRPGAAPAPARIGRPHPSPARPTTRLDLTLDRPEAVEWRLYGVAGRLLRRERLGRLGAGEHPLEWDGRDGAGRPLPAGVYWFEVRAGAARRASRIVLVR